MISKYWITGMMLSTLMAFSALHADGEPFGEWEDFVKHALLDRNLLDVRYGIAQGADVNQHEGAGQPHGGKTLLSYAISAGFTQAVDELLRGGALVEDQADLPVLVGTTLRVRFLPHLSYAIAVGASLAIIKLLVKYSKDLNICDMYTNRTPYEFAQHYGRKDVMKLLQKAGAHVASEPIPFHL